MHTHTRTQYNSHDQHDLNRVNDNTQLKIKKDTTRLEQTQTHNDKERTAHAVIEKN